MKQPSHTLARMHLRTIESEIGVLETEMMGFRFSGDCAEEVQALADRLRRLTLPHKGLNDATVFPGVELDPAPPVGSRRAA